MQLQAVIAPPPNVGWDAAQHAFGLVAEETAAGEGRRPGLLSRFRSGRSAEPAPVATFVPAEPSSVFVRVARFGNVTSTDATHLADALEAAAGRYPTPVVHVAGLEFREDDGRPVVAHLEGETDALATIFRDVNQVAKGQGFFLDRRNFRCELVVGRVDVPEGGRVPAVVGSTLAHRGAEWRASTISLVRSSHSASGVRFEEVASSHLGTATESARGLRLA
jgi:2'-5' RNA ligase